MTRQAQWLRLPSVLRERQQWLLAGPDAKGDLKVPLSINAAGERYPGSSTNTSTWMPFEHAVAVAAQQGLGIGYVLSASDPFTCVDLDVKNAVNYPDDPGKWSTPEQIALYGRILHGFNSYSERSQSGQGLHIWVLGKVGQGLKRDGVELYSQERFIACTGDVVVDAPVEERGQLLHSMATQMRAVAQARASTLVEVDEEERDSYVFEMARHAVNQDKFLALCAGRWEEVGEYPSQSEADLALMSMFTFYSKSNEQCRRLFRSTELGKRAKATKDDRYLNTTLALIRARQEREAAAERKLLDNSKEQIARFAAQEVQRLEAAAAAQRAAAEAATLVPVAQERPSVGPASVVQPVDSLPLPPGLCGEIAQFIYASSPRPVWEVSIVGALGWLAGVCGKAWVLEGTGLNLYVVLVARSAIGKEAMHGGVTMLQDALMNKGHITAQKFTDSSRFASAPALRKTLEDKRSFVNLCSEWGQHLSQMSAARSGDRHLTEFKSLMMELYHKSGPTNVVGGIAYSNKENTVASFSGAAFSMIGETTPEMFYECLTDTMMADGFISRFVTIEYNGPRPAENVDRIHVPSDALIAKCGDLCAQASRLMDSRQYQTVTYTERAWALRVAFRDECDHAINGTTVEARRQMWNRAQIKVMRIAALLAVSENSYNPMISEAHLQWAILVIRRDIALMTRKLDAGEVGTGDAVREQLIVTFCKNYLMQGAPKGYGVPEGLLKEGIVPRLYLQRRTQGMAAYKHAQQGATKAFNDALRSVCANGYLMEVDKAKMKLEYAFSGEAFRIMQLPEA